MDWTATLAVACNWQDGRVVTCCGGDHDGAGCWAYRRFADKKGLFEALDDCCRSVSLPCATVCSGLILLGCFLGKNSPVGQFFVAGPFGHRLSFSFEGLVLASVDFFNCLSQSSRANAAFRAFLIEANVAVRVDRLRLACCRQRGSLLGWLTLASLALAGPADSDFGA